MVPSDALIAISNVKNKVIDEVTIWKKIDEKISTILNELML